MATYLLLTFRYRHNIELIADQAVRDRILTDLDHDGIAFMATDQTKGVLPASYGEAFHTPDYIRKNWGSYFEVCHIISAGAIGEETAVLRAREFDFPWPAVPAAFIRRMTARLKAIDRYQSTS